MRRILGSFPAAFQKEAGRYRQFLFTTRQLQRWTIYLALVDLRRFFTWAEEVAHVPGVRAVTGYLVRAYLAGRQQNLAQRSWAKEARAIRDFFRWAKRERLIFVDPTLGLKIGVPDTLMVGIPIEQQRQRAVRWLDPQADPLEAAAGLLFAPEFGGIPGPLQILGAPPASCTWQRNPYFFVNRLSIRQGTAVGQNYLTIYLHKRALGEIDCTLLQLRISYLVDVAATGRIKVLEYLGLTHSGSRHYLASTMGGLISRQLGGPVHPPRE